MPFSTLKSLFAEAEALLENSGLRFTDELIDVCCTGLAFFAREGDTYSGAVPFCTAFTPHFENEIIGLVGVLKNRKHVSEDPLFLYGEVQGRVFAVVEDLALFMREKKLRDGGGPQTTAEERVLMFFEHCGNWSADSGEVVTETYYKLLPSAVMRDSVKVGTKSCAHD